MSVGRLVRTLYLLYFSKPKGERKLFRAIRTRPIRSIVELGIGSAGRTPRILEVAGWRAASDPLRYTGIDLFEARDDRTGLTLKQTHARLQLPRVQVRLVPGDPLSALQRMANSLTGTDLLLIAADQDRQSLARAWRWVPRMLSPEAFVFIEEPAEGSAETQWRQITLDEVQRLAALAVPAQARAA